MAFKEKIYFKLFGTKMEEAWMLDGMLTAHADGVPHTVPQQSGVDTWTLNRIEQKLLADNLLIPIGSSTVITALGKLHLAKGGYMAEVRNALLIPYSFGFSLIACIISIISLIRSFIIHR